MVNYTEMNVLKKLTYLRDKLAEIYGLEATDSIIDNGNLTQLNNAILNINQVISEMKLRPEYVEE